MTDRLSNTLAGAFGRAVDADAAEANDSAQTPAKHPEEQQERLEQPSVAASAQITMTWPAVQAYAYALAEPEAALDGLLSKLGLSCVLGYLTRKHGYTDILTVLTTGSGRRPNPSHVYWLLYALVLICNRYGYESDTAVAACLRGKFATKRGAARSEGSLRKSVAEARKRCEADSKLKRSAASFATLLMGDSPPKDLSSLLGKIARDWRKDPIF